jgi:DNA-binding GntR family transcriptional regulator
LQKTQGPAAKPSTSSRARWRFSASAAQADRASPSGRLWRVRCLQFDRVVHHWWTDLAGNPWLKSDLDRHFHFLQIFQRWMAHDPTAVVRAYDEHMAILNAIRADDLPAAREALQHHIQNSARILEAAMLVGKEMK